jgi:hypothetical protein
MIILLGDEMDEASALQLEDLPVEILVKICRYLSARELYSSFSRLNIRLDSILKSLCTLFLITVPHWDPVLSFFDSYHGVQIYFNDLCPSTLSQFNFTYFIGVRSFSIFHSSYSDRFIEPIEQLERFICPDLCPYLQSLQIPYCSQKLADWIFTDAFPHLKRCHLYDVPYQNIVLPSSSNNKLPAFRQLTIRQLNGDVLENILLLCSSLRYLDFFCNSKLSPFIHVNAPYTSLKRLRLSRLKCFLFHDGQFDSLLSLFPNLTLFDLTVEQHHLYIETIDFVKIGQCLRYRLPRLSSLELRIYVTLRNHSSLWRYNSEEICQLHPLFKYFNKSDDLLHIASLDFSLSYNR